MLSTMECQWLCGTKAVNPPDRSNIDVGRNQWTVFDAMGRKRYLGGGLNNRRCQCL